MFLKEYLTENNIDLYDIATVYKQCSIRINDVDLLILLKRCGISTDKLFIRNRIEHNIDFNNAIKQVFLTTDIKKNINITQIDNIDMNIITKMISDKIINLKDIIIDEAYSFKQYQYALLVISFKK